MRVLEDCQALLVAIQPLLVIVQSLGIAGRPVSEHFDVLLELLGHNVEVAAGRLALSLYLVVYLLEPGCHLVTDRDELVTDRDELGMDRNELRTDRDELRTDPDEFIVNLLEAGLHVIPQVVGHGALPILARLRLRPSMLRLASR